MQHKLETRDKSSFIVKARSDSLSFYLMGSLRVCAVQRKSCLFFKHTFYWCYFGRLVLVIVHCRETMEGCRYAVLLKKNRTTSKTKIRSISKKGHLIQVRMPNKRQTGKTSAYPRCITWNLTVSVVVTLSNLDYCQKVEPLETVLNQILRPSNLYFTLIFSSPNVKFNMSSWEIGYS